MNKIITTSICIVLLCCKLMAQKVYFDKSSLSDSITLNQAMSTMCREILKSADAGDGKDDRYYLLFAVHFLSGQTERAQADIDSVRAQLLRDGTLPDSGAASGFFLLYSTYIRAAAAIKSRGGNLEDHFRALFKSEVMGLGSLGVQMAMIPLQRPDSVVRNSYKDQLARLKRDRADSMAVGAAMGWAQVYLRYIIESRFRSLARAVFSEVAIERYIIEDSVKVPMRDGSYLSAVIVRPRRPGGPQSVVMVGNLYASASEVAMAKSIAAHGYAGVIVNTRGKYETDQPVVVWEKDADDMYDAINWISRRPWCNGKIGMFGGSYLGFTQWAATKKLHPALKTIVPQVAAAPGIDFPMRNGIFMTYALRWLHLATDNRLSDWADFNRTKHWDSTFNSWYKQGLSIRKLDSVEGRPSAIFQKWLDHPLYDHYWQSMIPYREEFSRINIPVLTITGYFDGDQKGALYYYKEHRKWNKTARHYLLIGPYDHNGAQALPSPVVNGYTIDSCARINITDIVFKWFDYVLKDSSRPTLLADNVNYTVMGENRWKHVSSLQRMNNDTLRFYWSHHAS